jgi:Hsp20/alpha crystallin family
MCCAQTADKFQIKADIPGVTKQDIKLNVDGDVLSLSVQKAEQKQVRHHDSRFHQLHSIKWRTFMLRCPPLPLHLCLSQTYEQGLAGGGCSPLYLLRCTSSAAVSFQLYISCCGTAF